MPQVLYSAVFSAHGEPRQWQFTLTKNVDYIFVRPPCSGGGDGTSWHFMAFLGHIKYISAPWAHESTSLDVNKANGRLTSNAKGIFCDNVRCFATNKSCSNRCHLQECFKCSSLLACKGTAFNLFSNYIVFLASPCIYPLSCRLLSRNYLRTTGNSDWNKFGFFAHIKWQIFSATSLDDLDVNKANGCQWNVDQQR